MIDVSSLTGDPSRHSCGRRRRSCTVAKLIVECEQFNHLIYSLLIIFTSLQYKYQRTFNKQTMIMS